MGQVVGPSFVVDGIEPPGVRRAPVAKRRAFWGQVSQLVLAAKDAELRAGLDRWGNPLHAIAKYTREHRESAMGPADPNAPPLQPAHGLSRTRSLFWAEPNRTATGVVCWWLYDAFTGESWGEILRIHAQGGRRLPVRDVIGLAPQSIAKVTRQAAAWWAQYEGEAPEPRPLPYRTTGKGQAVRTPDGKLVWVTTEEMVGEKAGASITAQEALRRRDLPRRQRERLKARQVKIDNHVYTMQGGLGVETRRTPPTFGSKAPKPTKPKAPPRPKVPLRPKTFEQALESEIGKLQPGMSGHDQIRKLLDTHAVSIGEHRKHAMADTEHFKEIEYAGIKWAFAGGQWPKNMLAEALAEFQDKRSAIPDRVIKATSHVWFSAQDHKGNAVIRDVLKAKGFDFPAAAATGGDGEIVVYRDSSLWVRRFAHESGHNIATTLYGNVYPTGNYLTEAIEGHEPPVSSYAATSSAEDFAEAVKMYVDKREEMRRTFPIRFAIIDRLMTDPNYGG